MTYEGRPQYAGELIQFNGTYFYDGYITNSNINSGSPLSGASVLLAGDVTGTAGSTTVVKLNGNPITVQALGASQDGYVLTWDNTDGYWKAKPTSVYTSYYLTQANWYIDPINGSDGYDGKSQTFTSGTTGPIKTWAQLVLRWGTNAPTLFQTTTITFVNSQSNANDPVLFYPTVMDGYQCIVQGVPSLVASGTLGTVTAQNRSTATLLQAVLPSGVAAGNLLVDIHTLSGTVSVANGSGTITFSTSQSLITNTVITFASQPGTNYIILSGSGTSYSIVQQATLSGNYTGTTNTATTATVTTKAWVYKNVSGNNWKISAIMAPQNVNQTGILGPLPNLWTSGDTISAYSLPQINIVALGPISAGLGDTFLPFAVYNLGTFDESADSLHYNGIIIGGDGTVSFSECQINKAIKQEVTSSLYELQLMNCDFSSIILGSTRQLGSGYISGGQMRTGLVFSAQGTTIDGDVILAGASYAEFSVANWAYGLVYLETGVTLECVGSTWMQALNEGGNYGSVIWGPGTLNVSCGAQLFYLSAQTASNTFLNTGGLQIGGSATAYSIASTGNSIGTYGNISLTPANLDATTGSSGFGGLAFVPGAGSITNGNKPYTGTYLTQSNWYIDPVNGFDGYTGTASSFSSGTTGPIKTWAELVRRWGTNAPILTSNVTITFVNGQSTSTTIDPVVFQPVICQGAIITLQGTLQQVMTGTLAGITSKNRSSNQLLTGTFLGVSANQLVQNTTHSSQALIYKNTSGNTWALCQPLSLQTSPIGLSAPSEVDTWANGDGYTIYNVPNVSIAKLAPIWLESDSSFNNNLSILNLTFGSQDINGGVYSELHGNYTALRNVVLQTQLTLDGNASGNSFYNSYLLNISGRTDNASSANFYGGWSNSTALTCGAKLDADIIMDGQTYGQLGNFDLGCVYIETGAVLYCGSTVSTTGTSYNSGQSVIWGGGTLSIGPGSAYLNYSGTATALFKMGAMNINGSTKACSIANGKIYQNITLSGANLDTTAGPSGFGGFAFIPGSGVITNTTPSQGSFLGTAGQVEFTNAAATDTTWASISGDGYLSTTTIGQLTVTGLYGNKIKPATFGVSQDGYVLTWVNADGYIEAKPAGSASYVTMGGDISGNSNAATVIALQGNAVQAGTLTSAQDGYVLTWEGTNWQAQPSGSAITLSGDVTGTATANTVVSISGTSPIAITPTNLQWKKGTTAPLLSQATPTTDVATQNLTIQSQAPYASASSNTFAGDIILNIPASISGTTYGYVEIEYGGTNVIQLGAVPGASSYGGIWGGGLTPTNANYSFSVGGTVGTYGPANTYINAGTTMFLNADGYTYLTLTSSQIEPGVSTINFNSILTPVIEQASNSSASAVGATFTIQAQNTTGTNSTGGNLVLSSGDGYATSAVANAGNIDLQTGGTNQLVLSPTLATFTNPIVSGTNPAQSGQLRLPNSTGIYVRNSANSNDLFIAGSIGANIIAVGDANNSQLELLSAGSSEILMNSSSIQFSPGSASGLLNNPGVGFGQIQSVVSYGQYTPTSDAITHTMTVQAQTAFATATTHTTGGNLIVMGGNGATSNSTSTGVGGNLILASGDGYTPATPGSSILFEIGPNTHLTLSGTSTVSTLQYNSGVTATINQAALSSTSSASGTSGVAITLNSQAGQAATGASHNGGAGGNLALAAGVGGTSGSATAGKGGVISLGSGMTVQQITITASTYSVDTNSTTSDYVIFTDSTSNSISITLPAPTSGRTLIFKDKTGKAETNNIKIFPHSSETIDGSSSYTIAVNYASIMMISDSTNWAVC